MVEEITHKQTPITSTLIHQQPNSSTLDSRRSELVEEGAITQDTTSRHIIIMDQRTTDPRHRGLVGNKSHADINALMMINQDRRSILISDDEPNQQRIPIDDNFYKRKSVFERLGGPSSNFSSTNISTLKDNRQYQPENDQANNKRPKYESNNNQAETYEKNRKNQHDKQSYNQQSKQSKFQTQYKKDKSAQPSIHLETNKNYDDHRDNQRSNQERKRDRYSQHEKNKSNDKPRENAHNRDTSHDSQYSRHSYQDEQVRSTQSHNSWSHQNKSTRNKQAGYRQSNYNDTINQVNKVSQNQSRKAQVGELKQNTSQNNKRSISSFSINKINLRNETSNTTLDLNITRRPLSPLNKAKRTIADLKNNNSRYPVTDNTGKVDSTNKPHITHTSNKISIKTKPATTTNINKNKTTPQQPKVSKNKILHTRVENETFEDIAESDLPIIGEISSSNTPQSNTISQSTVSDQEEALAREIAMNTTIMNETSVVEASTRGESQGSLLGEKPISPVKMKAEEKSNTSNVREESQYSMIEIRRIISTPIEVNEVQADIDVYQYEQDTGEQEITITAILEGINKSSSTKSENSTLEDKSNEPRNNNTQYNKVESERNLVVYEQSTRDSQVSLLGGIITEPPSVTHHRTTVYPYYYY